MSTSPSDSSTRCAVAAVVRHPEAPDTFLAVKRPPDDEELPDLWGLPAVTLQPGELPEEGLRRIGTSKLAAPIEPTRFVGVTSADRGGYQLVLMDIEARLTDGRPAVTDADPEGTKYVSQRWTSDVTLLQESARNGSLCSQVLLESDEWGRLD